MLKQAILHLPLALQNASQTMNRYLTQELIHYSFAHFRKFDRTLGFEHLFKLPHRCPLKQQPGLQTLISSHWQGHLRMSQYLTSWNQKRCVTCLFQGLFSQLPAKHFWSGLAETFASENLIDLSKFFKMKKKKILTYHLKAI